VTSDDPGASERISAFASDRSEWLVAVRMVSEGVDIPRLRVGVYATTTTTDLFFRQAVGRFVRWVPGIPDQRAWLYLPDDQRLRLRAAQIAEQRRHSLRREARPEDEGLVQERPTWELEGPSEQLSMFAALSAVAIGESAAWSPWQEPLPDTWSDLTDPTIEIELAPVPPLGGDAGGSAGSAGAPGVSRHQRRERLRTMNADVARELVRATGMTHAQVNLELNRLAGVGRIAEATIEQLEARLASAWRWRGRLAR
jgi:superfamily II DNA or RNA helicase